MKKFNGRRQQRQLCVLFFSISIKSRMLVLFAMMQYWGHYHIETKMMKRRLSKNVNAARVREDGRGWDQGMHVMLTNLTINPSFPKDFANCNGRICTMIFMETDDSGQDLNPAINEKTRSVVACFSGRSSDAQVIIYVM